MKDFIIFILLYFQITANLVRRAEKAGFQAIVLTIDAPTFGKRLPDIRNKFKLPSHLRIANFDHLPKSMNVRSRDPSLTWEGISWLKSITSLPIIVKGVLHPEDAVLAIKYGVAGMSIFSIFLFIYLNLRVS